MQWPPPRPRPSSAPTMVTAIAAMLLASGATRLVVSVLPGLK